MGFEHPGVVGISDFDSFLNLLNLVSHAYKGKSVPLQARGAHRVPGS